MEFSASPQDADRLARYRDKGIARVVVMLPSGESDAILPMLDRWAELIRRSAGSAGRVPQRC